VTNFDGVQCLHDAIARAAGTLRQRDAAIPGEHRARLLEKRSIFRLGCKVSKGFATEALRHGDTLRLKIVVPWTLVTKKTSKSEIVSYISSQARLRMAEPDAIVQ
jgi:hypothetical protein